METKQKNMILIILYLFIALETIIFGSATLSEEITDYTALVPGDVFFDQFYFMIIGPFIMILLVFLLTIPLARVFFSSHKIIKVRRYDYYAIKDFEGEISLLRTFIRCLIVSFLSFSLGLIIYESGIVAPEVIIPEKTSVVETDYNYVSMLALFILPYLILILAPIWLLRDSGLVCVKSNIKKEKRETPDIEGVYRYYNSVITGYTGIGFVFTLIILIVDRLEKLDPGSGELTDIHGIFLTPFLIAFLIFPAMIFYEYRLKHMKIKLLQKLEKGNLRTIESIKEIL